MLVQRSLGKPSCAISLYSFNNDDMSIIYIEYELVPRGRLRSLWTVEMIITYVTRTAILM